MKLHTIRHGEVEIDSDKVLCNDIILPNEYNPHNVRLWIVGNDNGKIYGAAWAIHKQSALDELVDNDLLGDDLDLAECSKLSQEEQDDYASLGNAGKLFNLDNVWIDSVTFDIVRDFAILIRFAESRGLCNDNLGQL